jgi:hypothetical protein
VGCNAGIFLREAKDLGFDRVVGVDYNKMAFQRAIEYRDRINGDYELYRWKMQRCIDKLPLSDYHVMANTHYYFTIKDWLLYMDALQYRTRYCIIVSAKKRFKAFKVKADPESIKEYFKDWEFVGEIPEIPLEGDPYPRRLYGLCFKSKYLKRLPIKDFANRNKLQKGFYKELDEGKEPKDTKYFQRWTHYKKDKEKPKRIERRINKKAKVYKDLKERGLRRWIIVDRENRIVDGNHRAKMLEHLGHKTMLVRRTA